MFKSLQHSSNLLLPGITILLNGLLDLPSLFGSNNIIVKNKIAVEIQLIPLHYSNPYNSKCLREILEIITYAYKQPQLRRLMPAVWPRAFRGGSRNSGKGVHMYKGEGVRFADFISLFLNIL